ncbi:MULTISPECIES: transporter [Dyella]|uniref:transporter n=1 Tax=Dyella TaxID=231454 RepID=UPI001F0F8E49|nr:MULTISPECIES: transporter [Dyella]
MTNRFYACAALPLLLVGALPSVSHAQDADALAKKLANPVASLISVPFQYNVDFNVGPYDGTQQKLNIQPVIPTSISSDWNLISRIITPVVYQNDVTGRSSSEFGLGDMNPEFFFSPKQPSAGGWIFGIGPTFLLPTATDKALGTEKWGAGPTGLALRQTDTGWTYGMLVNHIWSFAGNSKRNDISNTFLQPFLAKQFKGGRTLTVNIESTYDWKGKDWTVPINLMYSKVTKIGGQMISYQGGVRYYAEAPNHGPDWGLRFSLTLLFPEH